MGSQAETLSKLLRALQDRSADEKEVALGRLSHAITSRIYETMVIEAKGFEPPRDDRKEWDEEYRRRICQLPSEDLLTITEAYEKGLYKRAPDTIEAVMQELAERGLLK